jgi:predicted nucleic acid-binding protein
MEAFVLDASVAVSWCFPGDLAEDTLYSREILALLQTSDAIVPEIWPFEVANSIFVSFNKRRRISEQQIADYLQRLKQLPIRVEAYSIWSNVDREAPARKWNLSPYDAAYLALALHKRIPLATADGDLKNAAAAEGVEVVRTRSIK